MAFTATQVSPPGSTGSWDQEVHTLVFTSTTATGEVTTNLSEIYAAVVQPMYGADAGHTDDDVGLIEIDETATAGVITPASNAITVNRIATNAAGTLAGQQALLILWGKS